MVTIYTQAYNVEPYIEQCIKSVLSQTYRNFEWLLIENGSTDGTRAIIQKYEQLDDRIKVEYFEKNQTGFANDYIVQKARGEYIVKLDSDDWIDMDYLEVLLESLENEKADLAICGWMKYDEETGKEFFDKYQQLDGVYYIQDIKKLYVEMWSYTRNYWGKMLRKKIFDIVAGKMETMDARLKESGYFGGDTIFVLRYLEECKKMVFVNKRLYHYRVCAKNYAVNTTIGIDRVSGYVTLREIDREFLRKCKIDTKENQILVDISFWEYIGQLLKYVIQQNRATTQRLREVSEICADFRVRQIGRETYTSKVRTVLTPYIAWCYMNMEAGDSVYLKDMLILLEPSLFENISDAAYEWLLKNQILMSYIIMGEYVNAREYMKQISTGDNESIIAELLKGLT